MSTTKSTIYETTLEDGTPLNSYLACAYAEGFCEGDNASEVNQLRAWSYIIGTGIWRTLQGWYGRTVAHLIEQNLIDKNGKIITIK